MQYQPNPQVQQQFSEEELMHLQNQQQIDQGYQQVVQDIVNDNTQVFGRKNKPRNTEPNMFQLLSWTAKEQEQWDYKSINPNVLKAQGYSKFKARIAKTDNAFTSEQRDQFRKYHHDNNTGAYLPEFDIDQIEALRQEKEGINVVEKQGVPLAEVRNQVLTQQPNKNLNLNDIQNKLVQNQVQQRKKLQQSPQKNAGVYYYKDDQNQSEEEDDEQQQQELYDAEQLQQQQIDELAQQEQPGYQRPIPTTDLKKVKSKLLSYKKQAKQLDPVYEKERLDRRHERIQNMEGTTRWLSNTAFTTYFGKPAWENYGMGNVKPAVGGLVYGQYLLSHNVNPHKGNRQPQYIQSHKNALDFGERLPDSEPQPPRNCKEEFRLSQKQVTELQNRNPLVATRNTRENLKIVKPDLVNCLRFASEENSPEREESEETRRKKLLEQNKSFKRVSKVKSQSGAGSHFQSQQKSVQILEPQPEKQQQAQKQIKQQPQQVQQQQLQAQNIQAKAKQTSQTPAPAKTKTQPAATQKAPKTVVQKKKKQSDQNQQQAAAAAESKFEEEDEHQRRFFIKELQRKKQQANRLALKVTEVIPVPNENTRPKTCAPRQRGQDDGQIAQQQATAQQAYDEMNPPNGCLQDFEEYELNPQNYRNIPPQWMKRIPYAGKKLSQQKEFSIFHKN